MVVMSSASAELRCLQLGLFNSSGRFCRQFSNKYSPRILAMAPQKKVNKYDSNWEKKWFGAGFFVKAVKLKKLKVVSNVEKAGLLTKAEDLGFTLSSIEKLGLFSKAEELGPLSLLENAVSSSPSTLASAALPILVAAIVAIVVIPDDSASIVAVQAVVVGVLGVGAVGLFVGSVVLGGLQEAD